MARSTIGLTDTAVRQLKPKDKDYVKSDGKGLQLRVRMNGSKLWNFNYIHPTTKKRVNMGLGSYPDMSLKKARELTEAARSQVAEGVDPKLAREEERAAQRYSENATLRKVAEEWFEVKKSEVTADYADDIWRSLELHVFNRLGETPVSQISAQTVIDVLRPVEKTGRLETVKRVIQRLNEIMNYAVIKKLITGNPIAAIKSAFKKPKKQHLPTITAKELPDFLRKLHETNVTYITRQVIKWQLLTMTRPSEAAGAKWSEIQWLDDGQANWLIPAERMKKRRQHTVPLCEQALRVLEDMKSVSDQYEHIFISLRKPQTSINSQTANMALRRMGYQDKLVSHGLRALASTIMNEEGKDPDLIESALAHGDPNQVRSAYNRADYLERRRELMQWWGGYLDEAFRKDAGSF